MRKFKSSRVVEGFRDRTVAGTKPTAIVPGTSWDGIRIPAIGNRISVKANVKWYEGVVTYSSNFYVDVKVDRRGTSTVGSDEFTTRLRKPQMTEGFRDRTANPRKSDPSGDDVGIGGALIKLSRLDKQVSLYQLNRIITAEEWNRYNEMLWKAIQSFGLQVGKYIIQDDIIDWHALSKDLSVAEGKKLSDMICDTGVYDNWGIR